MSNRLSVANERTKGRHLVINEGIMFFLFGGSQSDAQGGARKPHSIRHNDRKDGLLAVALVHQILGAKYDGLDRVHRSAVRHDARRGGVGSGLDPAADQHRQQHRPQALLGPCVLQGGEETRQRRATLDTHDLRHLEQGDGYESPPQMPSSRLLTQHVFHGDFVWGFELSLSLD